MRVVIRSAGVVVIAIVAVVLLAFTTTMTSARAATALMVGGILASDLPDSMMSRVLNGKYTGIDKASNTAWGRKNVPWSGSLNLGQSIPEATNNLYDMIMETPGPKTVVAMSAGSLAAEEVLRRLANDPDAPDPKELNFVLIADSSRQPFFTNAGGPLTTLFGYVFQAPAETPYNVTVVTYEYDGFSDLPDRLWNGLAMANAMAGGFLLHNATFFVDLSTVPAENITTTVNSAGGVTTRYLIPTETLPLVQLNPWLAPIEQQLKQQVDAGYSRNDQRAVTSLAVSETTAGTNIESFSLTVDPPVGAPTEPAEASARTGQGSADATDELSKAEAAASPQTDQGLIDPAQPVNDATDGLATATSEAPAQPTEGLDSTTEAVSEKTTDLADGNITDLTHGNQVSPSTTAGTRHASNGWKPGDGIRTAIRQFMSGTTASTSTSTGTPTNDTSTQTDSETSSSTSSSSSGGTP